MTHWNFGREYYNSLKIKLGRDPKIFYKGVEIMNPHVTLPKDKERRRKLYCMMLDIPENYKFSIDELEEICISRGYELEEICISRGYLKRDKKELEK